VLRDGRSRRAARTLSNIPTGSRRYTKSSIRRTAIGSGMGAFAVFADPVGNEFGLYEEPR